MKRRINAFAFTILFFVLIGFSVIETVFAQAPTEGEVKAAFIYNFTKFVEWPERSLTGAFAPINICVFGAEIFGGALDKLEAKTVRGKPIKVRLISEVGEGADLLSCQLLFVNKSEASQLPTIFAILGNSSVLTVSDMDSFVESGGMIGLERSGRKIGIAINSSAVSRGRLKISSRLLALARIVGSCGARMEGD